MKATCCCVGFGEVEEGQVEDLKTLVEVICGRKGRRYKVRVYNLKASSSSSSSSAERSGGRGHDAKQVWAEEDLEEKRYTYCTSGWMRSAAHVKGNVGLMASLTETEIKSCGTKDEFHEHLQGLNLAVSHDYLKEGYCFDLIERGQETLLTEEAENKFQITCRIVELKLCEEVEGILEAETAFPGKWLVELVAKASGADYTQAVGTFEDFARKIHLVDIRSSAAISGAK
ncbi:hypothetical protein HOP50_10g58860 [Chloropicon primus]|nr:hypothetical protein HOP50_10g58860 [Chloropicon primus]